MKCRFQIYFKLMSNNHAMCKLVYTLKTLREHKQSDINIKCYKSLSISKNMRKSVWNSKDFN